MDASTSADPPATPPGWLCELALAALSATDPGENARAFAEAIVAHTPWARVWVYLARRGPPQLTVARPQEAGGCAQLGPDHPALRPPGDPGDYQTVGPDDAAHRRLAAGTELTAGRFVHLPLTDLGALVVHSTHPPLPADCRALQRATRRFAVAEAGAIALAQPSIGWVPGRAASVGERTPVPGARSTATQIARLKAERRRSELTLETLLENLPHMIFVKDAEALHFLHFNRAAEELLGRDREEMIGRNDYDLFPQEEADFFTRNDRLVLLGGEILDVPEEPIHTRLKGTRYLHTKKIPILDDLGEPLFLLGISEDITEQKRTREALVRASEQLERRVRQRTQALLRANEELEAFVHSVSHDLRAPVRSIHSFAELLVDAVGPALGEEGRDFVDRILTSCRRLERLFNALLTLSHISRATPRPRQVNLSEIVTRLAEEMRSRYPHPVQVEVQPGMGAVGDPELLEIALENLIGNAFKFTRDAATPRIEMLERDGRWLIRDNGIGFDPKYTSRLFKPFNRLHSADFEGSGIGLATAWRVVQRHGGAMGAEGVPGQGALFWFTLGDPDSAAASYEGEAR